MKKINHSIRILAAAITLAFLFYTTAGAQTSFRMKIEDVNSDAFPQVEAYLSISDAQGLPLRSLTTDLFTVSEDGIPVNSFEVTPVQNVQQSLAFALAIDASGSMGWGSAPHPLDNAVVAAKEFVATLSPQDQIGVISFADDVTIVQELTSDFAAVQSALSGLRPSGDTALNDALLEAVNLVRDADSRRAVILITDGVESGISKVTLETALSEAIRAGVPIYPIGFGEVDEEELARMAQLTGGYAQIRPNSRELQQAFSTVTQILREQYLVRYTSSLPPDGKEHQLVVTLRYHDEYAEQSYHFVAVPGQLKVVPNLTDGQVIGGQVKLAPQILSPVPIKRLDISIDDGPLASAEVPPYEFDWDSTEVAQGEHQLCFKVTDPADRTDEACVRVTVAQAITIVIDSPAEGSTVGNAANLSATITSLSALAKVEFLVDDRSVNTFPPGGPFTTEWPTAGLAPGEHTFTVRASDATGFTESASVNFQVFQILEITFTGPPQGEPLKGSTTISVDVSSPDPVKQVEIKVDGSTLATLQTGPYQVEWPLYNVTNGEHTITAVAINETGHQGEAEIKVQVNAGGGGGGGGGGGLGAFIIGLAVILVAAAILIPLALRRQKEKRATGAFTPGSTLKVAEPAQAVLVELQGHQPNQVWHLGEGEVRLGRKRDENDIPLKGLAASRRHAVIRFQQGVYVLYNLNPQNPVLINEEAVAQQRVLKPGDILQLGETVLRFEIG